MKNREELEKELTELKVKYPEVWDITVPADRDETETITIFLKTPKRLEIGMTRKLISNGDTFKAMEAFLKALYVGGDELTLVLSNDVAFLACDGPVASLMETKQGTLKKN